MKALPEGVTPREYEVFWLVGDRLHNQEIADTLGLSARTVESHVSSLLRKFGGNNRQALVEAAARLRARPDPGSVLPRPLSSFVGRTGETADLLKLVGAHRLLTMTGPAGTGKTRLALHLAHEATDMPPAVLVDLASVPPGDPVERAFADALGVSGDERALRPLIRGALAEGARWLVVDNCEHVTATAAPLLADLLAMTPQLHALATSHGPLGVDGEVVYEIPPLPLPQEVDDPSAVLEAASVRLFADRAAAVAPGFAVHEGNARDVAMICRRLDGLPLAIELAAARVRFFAPADLLRQLDDRFALLTDGPAPSRHRTLEGALKWSYELLGDDERLLFERCSVFPGEFDYDTATRILAYPPLDSAGLVRLFPRLLDRSLIFRRSRDDITEYRLLDSVRQFAHRELDALGAAGTARERHALHHLRHAVELLPDVQGRDQATALRWFDRHWADLRAAMRWALEQDDHLAAWEFLAGIGGGWETLGARGELFDWLDRLLERPLPGGRLGVRAALACAVLLAYQDTGRGQAIAEQVRARGPAGSKADEATLLLALGFCATADCLEKAAVLFEELGDDWHLALSLCGIGYVAEDVHTALDQLQAAADLFGRLHDLVKRANCLNMMAIRAIEARIRLDEAGGWLAEAVRLARASGNDHERLHAELYRVALDQHEGDREGAAGRFAVLRAEFRRIGDLRCTARCLYGLGREAADPASAWRHFAEGAELAVGLADVRGMVTGLRLLAGVANHPERAAMLLGAADRLDPGRRADFLPDDGLRAALCDRLGADAFAAALAAGRQTPIPVMLAP
ncbi:LuxR C-terminal-related transcriptional regulator [Nonomuraea sp. NPDC050556]|uniref:LuxR C-terminal-related transcriptional regulator n=1 Tax=Nonomuraea sp. NPDC050556 TaxID=3364369 RepID=UPI00379353AB